jgi:hypothetical protein
MTTPTQEAPRALIDMPMSDTEFRRAVFSILRENDVRMERMEDRMETNTGKIDTLTSSTHEMLEVFNAMKGGFKVLEWLARIGKIVAGLAALIGIGAKLFGWKWPFN